MGPSLFKSPSTSFLVSVLAFLVLPLPFGTPAYSAGAFSSLHGTWSGGGTVRLENGKSKKSVAAPITRQNQEVHESEWPSDAPAGATSLNYAPI